MMSEAGLDRHMDVLRGMLLAAAPASVVALRLGRMGLSLKRICWTGFWGMWLPLAGSVTLMTLAKMWGARLYWEPSVPIEFVFAFVWAFRLRPLLWLWPAMSLTLAAVGVACAMWMEEMTAGWRWRWRFLMAVGGVGLARVLNPGGLMEYWQGWTWSILAGSVAAGVWASRVVGRTAGRRDGPPSSE
jgi:hypothetical protein